MDHKEMAKLLRDSLKPDELNRLYEMIDETPDELLDAITQEKQN